jgi:acetyl-CoA synthetase
MGDPGLVGYPRERVDELISIYGDPRACAAYLLCDRHDPNSVACTVVDTDFQARDFTYGHLRARSERLASSLAELGISAGDRVATLMGKSEVYLVSVLAIWRLGAVHVPLFTAFAPPAINFRLAASSTRAVICDESQAPKLSEGGDVGRIVIVNGAPGKEALNLEVLIESSAPVCAPALLGGDAPLIQIYTSGTTGTPKGVLVPISALASFQIYLEFGLGVTPDDIYWNAADPGWAYGLYYAVLAPLAAGVRSTMYSGGFSPEATFRVLDELAVTNFAAAPTIYRSLRVSSVQPQSKLRCASSAGEPLTPEVNAWAVGALGVAVHDHYGQTETGMLINNHQHQLLSEALHPGSMGKGMPGWQPVILQLDNDEPAHPNTRGRLAMDLHESPLAWFSGYVGDVEKTREKLIGEGRWYLTGDVAQMDEDSNFYFASRDDDVIIMAGYRIGPFEVESVILTHEAVAECAAIAAPDEIRGEVLEVVVVLQPGTQPSDELTVEIQTLVKTGFAAHAYPRHVHYVDALPKTPSGKIQRYLLKQQRQRELQPK